MSADERRLRVLLIEDDAPLMRTMAWALIEDGFDVQVISKHDALELRGLQGPDVAAFNMKATATEKTAYHNQLRMLNPNCILIDVDEFAGNGGSTRDSGADSYTARPLNLEALVKTIRDLVAKPLDQRQHLRNEREDELRGERQPGSPLEQPDGSDAPPP